MLNIINTIGYVLASLAFVYVIAQITKEALIKRNKWLVISIVLLVVSIVLMVAAVLIALSEVI